MMTSIAVGAMITLYSLVGLFCFAWLFASEKMTWIKPPPWLDQVLNITGMLVLLTLALGLVLWIYRAMGVLVFAPSGGW